MNPTSSTSKSLIYLIGSLRNPNIPLIANKLREAGFDVFDDWFAPGPETDDWWQKYEQARGRSYKEALRGFAANHVYEFDRYHLSRANLGLLVTPCGKSGHLELGYLLGRNTPGYVLFTEEPERWDVMYQFAWDVFFSLEECIDTLSANYSKIASS